MQDPSGELAEHVVRKASSELGIHRVTSPFETTTNFDPIVRTQTRE